MVINEFMSSNDNTLDDEDGDSSDWLEMYNGSGEPISLAGYHLSDDTDDPHKWPLPAAVLPAKSYLIIFCSGKNRGDADLPLHTNFKLAASGEDILLVKNEEIVQHLEPVSLGTDVAFAAFPGERTTFLKTSAPSPGGTNLLGYPIGFSLGAGFYDHSITLSMSFPEPAPGEVVIRYTTTGADPDGNADVFDGGILIDDRSPEENTLANIPNTPDYVGWDGENFYPRWTPPTGPIAKGTVIKAAAFLGGQRISRVATRTYFIFPEGEDRYDFPVVSISCPADSLFSFDRGIYVPGAALEADDLVWSGNYFNKGVDWERESNFEYFEGGRSVVNQTMGVRVHGGKTRGATQKSLRLYARSAYGKSTFEHPFFGDDGQPAYKRLLLRTTMGAWTNSIITDAFAHQATRGLNFDIQEYQPVIVFLNGEYWGIHELREHVSQHTIAGEYGLDKDDINIHSSYGEVVDGLGEDTEFIFLRDQYIVQNDITNPEVYDYVKQRIDVDNFIDYFLAEVYFNNLDWPGNNSKMWRSAAYDDKFRWLFYDLDAGMAEDRIDHNLLAELLDEGNANEIGSWATALIRRLLDNESFRGKFISRARYLLRETFSPETLYPLLVGMTAEYEGNMDEHLARWGGWQSTESWKHNVATHMTRFALLRSCEMETQLTELFNIDPFLDCGTEQTSSVVVYPNPVSGVLNVELKGDVEQVYFCYLYNQLGQPIALKDSVLGPFGGSLDLSGLPAGGYHLLILDARMGEVATQSIIVH